jgi:hypothetical protein
MTSYRYSARTKIFFSSVLLSFIAACGGGGGGSDATASDSGSHLAVTGTKNVAGKPVVTICLNNPANTNANSPEGQSAAENLARFYFITGNYQIISSDKKNCSTLADPVVVSVSYYNDTLLPWIKANPPSVAGTSGTGTSGTGTSGSTTSVSDATQYVTWANNANGEGIRDFSSKVLAVRTSDRRLVYWPGNNVQTPLTGLTVDTNANLLDSGVIIGYVGNTKGSDGSNISAFFCSDRTGLSFQINTGWSYSCASGSGTSGETTSSGGGGSTSGGTTSGGGGNSSSGGTTSGVDSSGGGASRSFYSWTGSVNDEIVLDATDERFRFYTNNGCLYSDNTQTEYTNFCIRSGAIVSFSGTTYTITQVRSTTGQCIAGLLTSDGYFADIFTSGNRVETITKSSKRPQAC